MYASNQQEASKPVSEKSEEVPIENLPLAQKVEELEKMRKRRAKRNSVANESGDMDAFSFFFGKPKENNGNGSQSPRPQPKLRQTQSTLVVNTGLFLSAGSKKKEMDTFSAANHVHYN